MTAPLLWFAAAFAAVAADEERGGHGVLARCRMRAKASDVDLFLGTGGEGHMHPGAMLPFGMVHRPRRPRGDRFRREVLRRAARAERVPRREGKWLEP